jgi:hypothetical protein
MSKTLSALVALLLNSQAQAQITDPSPYCAGSGTPAYFDPIRRVQINDFISISNGFYGSNPFNPSFTGTSKYVYFNGYTPEVLTKGVNIPCSVELVQQDMETKFLEVYADLNKNGIFEASEKVGFVSSATIAANNQGNDIPHSYNFNILIPASAQNGVTRLRVLYKGGMGLQPNIPCPEGLSYGEIEDYNISIETNPIPFPPSVQTLPATDLTPTGAGILQARVNANNGPAGQVSFEYGTTTAYGNTVSGNPASVTGAENILVSAPLTSLVNGTTYHCRAKVSAGGAVYFGNDTTFVAGASPIISMFGFSVETSGTPYDPYTLTAYVDANGATNPQFFFEYGFTSALGTTVSPQVTNAPGFPFYQLEYPFPIQVYTRYFARLKIVSGGVTRYSDIIDFRPAGSSMDALPAGNTGPSSATLNGLVRADQFNTRFIFQYGTTTAYGDSVVIPGVFPPATTDSLSTISGIVSNLLPNTTYHYRVKAKSYNGTVYYRRHHGPDQTFTTSSANSVSGQLGTFRMHLFPNPVPRGSALLIRQNEQEMAGKFSLLSSDGKVLLAEIPAGFAGEGNRMLPMPALSAGVYILQMITTDGKSWRERLTIAP